VENIQLIAASIMSKKLAEGISGLVLDVKRGAGAFLPALEDGVELARTMIGIGERHGCHTTALLTAMDRPLGRACGNALETEEAIAALKGEGPPDLMEVTLALGAEMLLLAGVERERRAARARLEVALASGHAAERFRSMVATQGGNPAVVDDPAVLPQAGEVAVHVAARSGQVAAVEPRTIGRAIIAMGGGRRTMDDVIDPSVGFVITAKPGDRVRAGEALASIYARDPEGIRIGVRALEQAIGIVEEEAAAPLPLVSHRVTSEGLEKLADRRIERIGG
jgi:thymidine phosphorylase